MLEEIQVSVVMLALKYSQAKLATFLGMLKKSLGRCGGSPKTA